MSQIRVIHGSARLFRWPILFIISIIVLLELIIYFILRLSVKIYELLTQPLKPSKKHLYASKTFDEWAKNARKQDDICKLSAWKHDDKSAYYDYQLVHQLMSELKNKMNLYDINGIMDILNTIFSKPNIAGIENEQLYSKTHFGSKFLIHDFLQMIQEATIMIRDSPINNEYPLEHKLEFFRHAKRLYGRTALVLSGGAYFGYYHVGVVKCLFEAGCLPKVLSGTSAGAMIAALVGVRTDEELPELFDPNIACKYFRASFEPLITKLTRFFRIGVIFDQNIWIELLCFALSNGSKERENITFREAYERTGRILNITATSTKKYMGALLLNHINAPNVVIWSAVLASCAIPGVIKHVELLEKDRNGKLLVYHRHGKTWSDGSFKADVPIQPLAQMHHVNYTIVSQVNPHVILFFYDRSGNSGNPTQHTIGSKLRGGFFSSALERFLALEMKKWLSLVADLDILPMIMGQDIRFTFTQEARGNVTISPSPRLIDYFRLINDPTPKQLDELIRLSSHNTWPHMVRITNHFIIEKTLRQCVTMLKNQRRRQSMTSSPRFISLHEDVPDHIFSLTSSPKCRKKAKRSSYHHESDADEDDNYNDQQQRGEGQLPFVHSKKKMDHAKIRERVKKKQYNTL